MVCKICGTELEEGAAFCHQCGERVTRQNVCPNCGKDLPDEAAFCMHCGTNLNGKPQETKTTSHQLSDKEYGDDKEKIIYDDGDRDEDDEDMDDYNYYDGNDSSSFLSPFFNTGLLGGIADFFDDLF